MFFMIDFLLVLCSSFAFCWCLLLLATQSEVRVKAFASSLLSILVSVGLLCSYLKSIPTSARHRGEVETWKWFSANVFRWLFITLNDSSETVALMIPLSEAHMEYWMKLSNIYPKGRKNSQLWMQTIVHICFLPFPIPQTKQFQPIKNVAFMTSPTKRTNERVSHRRQSK